jgi:hypothetical protein
MDRSGSGLWLLVFHELRFKGNRGLTAQGAVTVPTIIPTLDADKELILGRGVVGGHVWLGRLFLFHRPYADAHSYERLHVHSHTEAAVKFERDRAQQTSHSAS